MVRTERPVAEEEWLTKREAADLYRVTERTIEIWVRAERIPFRRSGRRVYLPRTLLVAALRQMPRGGLR